MNGIILINKPKEYTSHDIVAIIKKISKEKVGHTGTLDPMATGVLPLLIGKATGLSKYLINHDKTYVATIKLGRKTDTGDSEGNIIEEKNTPNLDEGIIQNILNQFIGEQEQIPPMYSAIKVNGKKLYEYARAGKEVEIKARNITIYNIKLLEYKNKEAEITFEVQCSKGTYIRTLCENIAEKLNTVGYMKELKRTTVGQFEIKNAIDIENIKNNNELLEKNIITIEEFLKGKNKFELNNKELQLFLNGVQLNKKLKDDIYRVYSNNNFIGTAICKENKLKRDICL